MSPNIFPALRYRNGAAAIEWPGKALGFEKQMVVPGPDGSVAHAQLKFGEGVVMLGSGKHEPPNPWDQVAQGIYVYVADVDAHYRRALAAGARIAAGPRDHAWGERSYEALDPEGHRWRFRQRLREVPP